MPSAGFGWACQLRTNKQTTKNIYTYPFCVFTASLNFFEDGANNI